MLTEQKHKYVEFRKSGLNPTDAAREAGYSNKTVHQQSSRLEKNPDVMALLGDVQNKPCKAIKNRTKTAINKPKEEVTEPSDKCLSESRTEQKENDPIVKAYEDPKDFLLDEINDPDTVPSVRHDAAKALMPYFHHKLGEKGKKESREDAAKKASSGNRFQSAEPPRLTSVK